MTVWDELLARYGLRQILEGLADSLERRSDIEAEMADEERERARPGHVQQHVTRAELLRYQAAMLILAAHNIELEREHQHANA